MKKAFYALVLLVSLTISYFVLSESDFYYISDAFFIIIPSIAAYLMYKVINLTKLSSSEGKVWLFLLIGMVLWLVGEAIWFYYETILDVYPFPSVADISFLLGYVFVLIGLFVEYNNVVKQIANKKYLLPLFTLLLSFAILYKILIYPIAISDYEILSKIVSLGYPIFDLFLIFGSLLFVECFRGAKLSKTWMLLLTGFALTAIADIVFSYLDWYELYESFYILSDIPWLLGYAVIAIAAYIHKDSLEG
ncbi:MAG: hypothetical protein J7K22_01820 [Nanoarchaeota archaeon]|nr:hypothetical protein [Nanoarchaeota archaeon]